MPRGADQSTRHDPHEIPVRVGYDETTTGDTVVGASTTHAF